MRTRCALLSSELLVFTYNHLFSCSTQPIDFCSSSSYSSIIWDLIPARCDYDARWVSSKSDQRIVSSLSPFIVVLLGLKLLSFYLGIVFLIYFHAHPLIRSEQSGNSLHSAAFLAIGYFRRRLLFSPKLALECFTFNLSKPFTVFSSWTY